MTLLTIDTVFERNSYQVKRVKGLTPFELDRLNRMPYQDMISTALQILDKKANGTGTAWQKEAQVLQMWVGADGLFVEIGGID